jgi:hypothetical protein
MVKVKQFDHQLNDMYFFHLSESCLYKKKNSKE